jgi:NADH-quinone oxidoreductase subunit A
LNLEAQTISDLTPLIVFFLLVLGMSGLMLGGSYFLGRQHNAKVTDQPFESGIVPLGDVHIRFSVQFYLLAIFFVIFDMESVFLYAWAVAFYESGWPGFIEAMIFIVVVLASLLYLWACGALDWRTHRQRIDRFELR